MPAAYDDYDYPSYWKGREYEHLSEFLAIKSLLLKIPRIEKSIEIGSGFGRLLPSYQFRVKKALLTDPSAKLIGKARAKYKNSKRVEFMQSGIYNLKNRKRGGSFDLALMVRVLHHIEDIDKAFETISHFLKSKGYFLLEFPNKNHLKASIKRILKGDFTFPFNIFPVDIRSKKHIKRKTLPFINYHPDQIYESLKRAGFDIIEVRSVSNIRYPFLKKLLPINMLLDIEKILQVPLSKFNFGPSFFVLTRKRV